MKRRNATAVALWLGAAASFVPRESTAQDVHGGEDMAVTTAGHAMWTADLGAGWRALGMAQAFPAITIGAPGEPRSPLHETEGYVTQAAIMADIASPGSRWVLRTTLNFEGLTQEDGELTFGGWGEGFIDRRHPHTLLHELVLSLNDRGPRGGLSLSAGKGFAPFGTDDPMGRPALKYPTNHHLSQVLERWLVAGAILRDGWSVEAAVFGGSEPDGPYDFSNIESFGDSWSGRVAKRWGGMASGPRWEMSASAAGVEEEVESIAERTYLWNAALRHEGDVRGMPLYALLEASASDPERRAGDFSVLAEGQIVAGGHRPYLRLEYANRPEFPREAGTAGDGFFRYEHHAEPVGATLWWIATAGYGFDARDLPIALRPFADVQYHAVRGKRGGIDPDELFGGRSFWSLSFGVRIYLGGEPMRMGAYGILDPMLAGHSADGMEMHPGSVGSAGGEP
jgi:hypothetical protein